MVLVDEQEVGGRREGPREEELGTRVELPQTSSVDKTGKISKIN